MTGDSRGKREQYCVLGDLLEAQMSSDMMHVSLRTCGVFKGVQGSVTVMYGLLRKRVQ